MPALCKYSICILDDKIPLSPASENTGIIEQITLQSLLSNEAQWKDVALLNLVKALMLKKEEFILSAFTHCNFFLNHVNDVIFSPDIIIFDWDYPGSSNPEEALLTILKSKYCLVTIFTGVDVRGAVDAVLAKDIFKRYIDRVKIIKKEDTDSVATLQSQIEAARSTFSFKYSHELKQKTLTALDSTLSVLGQLSFEQFVRFFGESLMEGAIKKRKLSALELAEIIADKLKTNLIDVGIEEEDLKVNDDAVTVDDNIIREICHFRLYHQPKDTIVRRGDIFEIAGRKVIVISSDCHLAEFGKKNWGYLMLTPLYRMDDAAFKKKFNDSNSESMASFSVTSLTNPRPIDSITVLPGLEIIEISGNKQYVDFFVAFKETFSLEVPAAATSPKIPLLYSNIKGAIFSEHKKLAEPFLTPLIQFIFQNITGLAVPDFPKCLNDSIRDKVKGLKNAS